MPQVGNQITFPVPPGILNVNGKSTIALSIWSQDSQNPAKVDIQWKVLGVSDFESLASLPDSIFPYRSTRAVGPLPLMRPTSNQVGIPRGWNLRSKKISNVTVQAWLRYITQCSRFRDEDLV